MVHKSIGYFFEPDDFTLQLLPSTWGGHTTYLAEGSLDNNPTKRKGSEGCKKKVGEPLPCSKTCSDPPCSPYVYMGSFQVLSILFHSLKNMQNSLS